VARTFRASGRYGEIRDDAGPGIERAAGGELGVRSRRPGDALTALSVRPIPEALMDRSPRHHRRPGAALLLVLVVLLITACGSGAALAPVGSPAAVPADVGYGTGSGQDAGEANKPQPAATGPAAGGGDGGNGNGGGSAGGNGAFRDLARIVYTGSLSLRVENLEAAVRAGRDVVLAAGGYVGSSRQTTDEEHATASVTYRIPSDKWEPTLDALRQLGSPLGEEIDSAEVTGQIVDLQARIKNLRVSEAAIQAIAEKAATFEEILEGQARLSSVREEIEQLDAQLANLEAQADLGTLTVTYGTEVTAITKAVEEARWDAGGEVARATATLVDMLQVLASLGIWFGIVWVPVLVVLLAIAMAVRLVLRRTGLLDRVTEPVRPTLPGT
jgi:hypothetical protein